MPHERFYLDDSFDSSHVLLKGSEFHHLANVTRIRLSEEVELVNGRGTLAQAALTKLDKEAAHLTILSREHQPQKTPALFLGCSLIRMNRLEWVIEKGTELGADAFYLFAADHSEKDTLSPHQLDRLRHLSISALKQCGRLYLPDLVLLSFKEILSIDALLFFGDTDPQAKPLPPSLSAQRILFLSGPEKGFSPREIKLLKEHGQCIRLHTNILRAETAPLVAMSLLSQN